MKLHPYDLLIIIFYLFSVAFIGFWVKNRAIKELESFYLANRSVPWWMLGLSGCSSYIDIGGTMAMIGALYYLGLKAIWATHIYWGWFIICFYMAFVFLAIETTFEANGSAIITVVLGIAPLTLFSKSLL